MRFCAHVSHEEIGSDPAVEQVFALHMVDSVRIEGWRIDHIRLAALRAAELGRFCGWKIGKMKGLPSISLAVRARLLARLFGLKQGLPTS